MCDCGVIIHAGLHSIAAHTWLGLSRQPIMCCRIYSRPMMSVRCRSDIDSYIWPLWFSDIGPTFILCWPDNRFRRLTDIGPLVFRHRPDIVSISARCRPGVVDDIWPTSSPLANMESARYQPTFADIGPI